MAESEAALTEISANEILDKIQKGEPVAYYHAIVTGDLDVNSLDLPCKRVERKRLMHGVSEECKVVSSSIEVTASIFNGVVNFSNISFEESINFGNTTFSMDAYFGGASFSRDVYFKKTSFSGKVSFNGATFGGDAHFSGATFSMDALFNLASFMDAYFGGAAFRMDAYFKGATFNGDLGSYFKRTTFGMNAYFETAIFNGYAFFSGARFAGDILTFRNAVFNKPKSQEEACRKAKNLLAKAGNRDEEEYHFYREMEAKRIQKGIRGNSGLGLVYLLKTDTWSFWKFFWYDVFEWFFIQKIFGYGVRPWWLIGWWSIIVTLFAIAYWAGNGIEGAVIALDYIKVSFATAIAPGYIAVIINPGKYRI